MKRLDQAIKSVPSWVSNKEISELLNEVSEEYYNSLGIDELLENMITNKNVTIEAAKQGHAQFSQK